MTPVSGGDEYLGSEEIEVRPPLAFPAARDLFGLVADARTSSDAYGVGQHDTLSARARLAHWTGQEGDAAEAREQLAALLPAYDRILGLEHQDTMDARRMMAWYPGRPGTRPAPATNSPPWYLSTNGSWAPSTSIP